MPRTGQKTLQIYSKSTHEVFIRRYFGSHFLCPHPYFCKFPSAVVGVEQVIVICVCNGCQFVKMSGWYYCDTWNTRDYDINIKQSLTHRSSLSWWWELIFWTLNCIFWFWTLRNLLSLTSLVCRKCCYVKSILTFINNCSNKIRNPPGVFVIFQRKNLQIPRPVFWRRSVILEQISAQTQNTQKSKSFACEALFSV